MSTAAAAPIPFSIRIGPRLLAGSVVSLGILFWIAVFAQLNYLVPLAQSVINSASCVPVG